MPSLQDLEASRPGSADNSRKNKRKNFRPRNIVYSSTNEGAEGGGGEGIEEVVDDEEINEEERKNSPMDLSVSNRPQEFDSSSEGCDSPRPGVSPGPSPSASPGLAGSPGLASSPVPSPSPNMPRPPGILQLSYTLLLIL